MRNGLVAMFAVLLFAAGCAPPAATIMLQQQGIQGLNMAQQDIVDLSAKLRAQYSKQDASLDAAFDQDVKACEAGLIKDASGNVVKLDSKWVIDSRKLYAASKGIVASNQVDLQNALQIRLDNIAAAKEALVSAANLITLQQNLDQNIKGWIMTETQKAALQGGAK